MKRFLAYIFLLVSVVYLPTEGQIVTVKAEFSADSVMLGEHFHYTLMATSDKDVTIKFPEYSDTISSEIEMINLETRDTIIQESGKRTISAKYKVISFSPGWNTIAPQPVGFDAGALTDTVYTTAQLLTVLTPEVDTTQAFKPIKPPINTPINMAELWPWLTGGALLALAVFFAIRAIRRYYRKLRNPEEIEQIHREPPHLEAFKALDRLRHDKLYQQGQVKEYYTQLTQIVRQYITRQFGYHALESTTQEILDTFRKQNNSEQRLNKMLEDLLMLADLVKFAKEDPLMKENEMHMENAELFVEKTYRMFEEESERVGEKESERVGEWENGSEHMEMKKERRGDDE
ncbi:MAG TPA: hypothetical protein VJ951_03415 [Bacteroidales bacterium]|nr:hypothetical protein [Bacteroidales bacterium]